MSLIFVKKYSEQSYVLRQAFKIARGKYNIDCHLSNNKLVMTDIGLAYSAKQLPDLNVKKSKFNRNNVSYQETPPCVGWLFLFKLFLFSDPRFIF